MKVRKRAALMVVTKAEMRAEMMVEKMVEKMVASKVVLTAWMMVEKMAA